jgi:hypothetical protein
VQYAADAAAAACPSKRRPKRKKRNHYKLSSYSQIAYS